MTYPQATVAATMATTIIPVPEITGSGSSCCFSAAMATETDFWVPTPEAAAVATTITPAAIGSSGSCFFPIAAAAMAAVVVTNPPDALACRTYLSERFMS